MTRYLLALSVLALGLTLSGLAEAQEPPVVPTLPPPPATRSMLALEGTFTTLTTSEPILLLVPQHGEAELNLCASVTVTDSEAQKNVIKEAIDFLAVVRPNGGNAAITPHCNGYEFAPIDLEGETFTFEIPPQ